MSVTKFTKFSLMMERRRNSDSLVQDRDRERTVFTIKQITKNLRIEKNFRVFLRVRAPSSTGNNINGIQASQAFNLTSENEIFFHRNDNLVNAFQFDSIFTAKSTFSQIFEQAVQPLTDHIFSGLNGSLITYGQTGSGKTYTLGAETTSEEGLIPYTLNHIFSRVATFMGAKDQKDPNNNKKSVKFEVAISMVQIYVDKVYDLLNPKQERMVVKQEPNSKNFFLPNTFIVPVTSKSDGMKLIRAGLSFRAVGAQKMNPNSSRSHLILTIHLGKFTKENQASIKTISKLNFVDLAGAERIEKTGSSGERFEEAKKINLSLSNLAFMINGISANPSNKQGSYIPYRENTLTKLLYGIMSADSRISLLNCISPAWEHRKESYTTCRFAARCKDIILENTAITAATVPEKLTFRKNALGSGFKGKEEPKRNFKNISRTILENDLEFDHGLMDDDDSEENGSTDQKYNQSSANFAGLNEDKPSAEGLNDPQSKTESLLEIIMYLVKVIGKLQEMIRVKTASANESFPKENIVPELNKLINRGEESLLASALQSTKSKLSENFPNILFRKDSLIKMEKQQESLMEIIGSGNSSSILSGIQEFTKEVVRDVKSNLQKSSRTLEVFSLHLTKMQCVGGKIWNDLQKTMKAFEISISSLTVYNPEMVLAVKDQINQEIAKEVFVQDPVEYRSVIPRIRNIMGKVTQKVMTHNEFLIS